jgi:hypothetical protein
MIMAAILPAVGRKVGAHELTALQGGLAKKALFAEVDGRPATAIESVQQ